LSKYTSEQLKIMSKYATAAGKRSIKHVIDFGSAQKAAIALAGTPDQIARQSINASLKLSAATAMADGAFDAVKANKKAKGLRSVKRWVITSAQNNSQIHQGFVDSIRTFCDHVKAQPIAIMARYKNPNSHSSSKEEEGLYWDHALDGWYLDKDVSLGPNLMISGGTKIPATSVNPLGGLHLTGRNKSMIVGHGQLQMRLVATPHAVIPKMLHSTGSCTLPNYGRSATAQKAESNHNIAALYVEMRGDSFYVFQLEADIEGHFYFLDKHFTPSGFTEGHRPVGYVIGDEHEVHMTDADRKYLWGKNGPIETLNPEALVRHDVDDFYVRNHHHKDDLMLSMLKQKEGHCCVEAGLKRTAKYLNSTSEGRISYVVDSNHPNAFGKWLNRFKPLQDIQNADFYARYMGSKANDAANWAEDDFTHFMTTFLPDGERTTDNIIFLTRNDQILLGGADVTHHGDKVPNGSRGSPNAFARSFNKTTTGHSHSPFIQQGAWGVGVHAMEMTKQYAVGIGSWMKMDVIHYADGGRCMITNINGKWRA
jgi:hypothetical protein